MNEDKSVRGGTQLSKNETSKKLKRTAAGRLMDIPESGIFMTLVVLVAVISILKPQFLGASNINSILKALPFLGIVAIGETLVILVGEIDISVGSVAGLAAVVSTWFMTRTPLGFAGGIAVALVLCSLVGVINALVVIRMRIPAFVATIGMLYIARGLDMLISKGYPIYPIPDAMLEMGKMAPFGTSIPFVLFIILVIIFEFILRRTVFGRNIYAIGNNKEVAKLSGINVDAVKISAYVITAFLSSLAGILVAAQLQTGSPGIGLGWEMQVVAATAIGGISLVGGAGTMKGTLIGIFIMAVLNNGLVLLGINTFIQSVVLGSIMIIAVALDLVRRNKKLKA